MSLSAYTKLLDDLCAHRRNPERSCAEDRLFLTAIDAVYDELSDADKAMARELMWRGWPEEVDARASTAP